MLEPRDEGAACPRGIEGADQAISLAQGEGGRAMRRLISEVIARSLGDAELAIIRDAARLPSLSGDPVLATDSFVVSPLFFPGGDIGKLAVVGTLNDLCVAGARPRWLTLAMVVEEGLPLGTLVRAMESAAAAARDAGVRIVTGDTKVVPRGAADQLFLCTTGLGEMVFPGDLGPEFLRPGDQLLVSGPVGRHGVAVMAAREHLGFMPPPESDCAYLGPAIDALREAGVPVRAMRDATRGGIAAVLHEWSLTAGLSLRIREADLPRCDEVRGVCELLGLDPLHVACEGAFVLAVPADAANRALDVLRSIPVSAAAAIVGEVVPKSLAPVLVQRGFGRDLPLDEPSGAMLPRIC